MSIVRSAERVLLSVGLVLLGMWGTVRLHSILGSRAAISQFRATQATQFHGDSLLKDPTTESMVDFRLWSPQRISAYQESLSREAALPLAVLRISKINLEVPVFDGTDDLTLNRGVGRISGTAQIGESGNLGIAGHRDGFFRGLQDVTKGDVIELDRPGTTSRYVVTQIEVVTPEDVEVLNPTPTPTMTLVTCFPFYFVGSAPKRFVVSAFLDDHGQSVSDRNTNSANSRN